MNCKQCQFFLPQNESQGLCRRYPPATFHMDQQIVTWFPTLLNEGLCGEFKPKDQPEKVQ